MKEITIPYINKLRSTFESDKNNKVRQRAAVNNGLGHAVRDSEVVIANPNIFTIELDNLGDIHDQKCPGRCWLFAALVIAEKRLAEILKVPSIKLSKTYTYFFDIFERVNSFYEHVIETAGLPLTNKKVQFVFCNKHMEGGYDFAQAERLIKKYGVVPEAAMPDTENSAHSEVMQFALGEKLIADAKKLRDAKRTDRANLKTKMLAETYDFLAINLGTPPQEFIFHYRPKDKGDDKKSPNKNDKKDKPAPRTIKTSPKDFVQKYLALPDDFVYLELFNSYKTPDWDKLYEAELIDPMFGYNFILATTRMTAEIKKAMVKQLKDGDPIWFAWDFGRQYSGKTGILDAELLKYNEFFDMEFSVDTDNRGLYADDHGQGHATAIVGVHLDENGNPIRWKVKNSHGKNRDGGVDGWVVMNDNYVDRWLYGIELRKKHLPIKIQKIFNQKPTLVKYWE